MSKGEQGTAVPCTTIANLTERSETGFDSPMLHKNLADQRLQGFHFGGYPCGYSFLDGYSFQSDFSLGMYYQYCCHKLEYLHFSFA